MDNKTLAIRVVLAALAGGGFGAYLHFVREHQPHHAGIIALAVAALVYTSFRSYDNLKNIYRR